MCGRMSLLAVVVVLVASRTGAAVTLSVPGDHATIQAAVDAAESGDTVVVEKGPWAESVLIDCKYVTIDHA